MIHNYYLYEDNGQLSMIPWDYNLAFGTFQGNQAVNAVNDNIDSPLSVTGNDRPMIDWIFSSEEYTELYHQYFGEFLNTVDAQSIIANAKTLIAPYVEKDPTKFCTYEEFEKGIETLAAFCDLRSQSIALQLAGDEADVDASSLNLSNMGTMGKGAGERGHQPEMSPNDSNHKISRTSIPQEAGDRIFRQEDHGQRRIPNSEQIDTGSVQEDNRWAIFAVTIVFLSAGLLFARRFRR